MPKNPVVLIHGIFDTERVFRRMRSALHGQGFAVHPVNLTPNNGKAGLDRLAEQLAASVEAKFGLRQPIDIVGFSMGGLVARDFLQRLGGNKRVERLITIATPHNGTWTAFLLGNAGARQMRPGSPFLKDLNCDVEMLKRVRVTALDAF